MITMGSRVFLYHVLRANGQGAFEAVWNVVRAAFGGRAYYYPKRNRVLMLRFREANKPKADA